VLVLLRLIASLRVPHEGLHTVVDEVRGRRRRGLVVDQRQYAHVLTCQNAPTFKQYLLNEH
jgi:hypothetical protein